MAADSTMLRMTNFFTALSLGTSAPLDSQNTRFTCARERPRSRAARSAFALSLFILHTVARICCPPSRAHSVACSAPSSSASSPSLQRSGTMGEGKRVFVENGFTNKIVFNMDETAVFWRRFRSTSILDHDRAGTAPSAARWTVILCANGNESKRFRPYFIQTQERCRHWGSWRPSKIDIEWRRQMSGWIDCIIFWDRLRTFNTLVAKEIGEKVILMMANAPQRKPPDGYEKLDYGNGLHGFTFGNVMIIYLPPNYTSHIQPLDQGTIRAASGSEQNWSEVDQLKYSRRTATMVMSLSLCPLHRIGMPAKHCLPAMPQPPRSTKKCKRYTSSFNH